MFEQKELKGLNDFFLELSQRKDREVYFYRINGYNEEIKNFIQKYYEQARVCGVVIEGKIPNPDEKNLEYYEEMMGLDFQMSPGFFYAGLRAWLPRMKDMPREGVAAALYETLDEMRRMGKNENMLKNAYIKFMCWFYYKFERIVNRLGDERLPKILYEGDISNYELKMLRILSKAGCDIVLLQYHGDENYRKLDGNSEFSRELQLNGMGAFPEGFSIRLLQQEVQQRQNTERLYGERPAVRRCTNAWMEGKGLSDILTAAGGRGEDTSLFYNCFCRISGVEDKLTYQNDLYQFYLSLKNARRNTVVIEKEIPVPSMEEINGIHRKNYDSRDKMLLDLSGNISYPSNIELQKLMKQSFLDVMLEESELPGMNVNRLTNRAVYLLCWLKRYQSGLFSNWKMPEIGCFIYLGGCRNENEALFLRFLSGLPVDVLILNPNLNQLCCLKDELLYEIHNTQSMVVEHFPKENAEAFMGTAAYHAERELDEIMYQDSGIYRNQQYDRASAVILQTMYEEIAILWDEELKYRPNFSVTEGVVNLPVIFSKVSGVKDGNVGAYWSSIRKLKTEDTFFIKRTPFLSPTDPNPMKAHATEFYRNGRLQKGKIKAHPSYQYGLLREEVQEHILDKLQLMIDKKLIKGTFENGTEYTIVATVLNLNKEILRMIQKFDFTKKNPKLVYIHTTEEMISLEDSILTMFLSLVGFDVVFFVPTGYQSVERYFNKKLLEEHQIGEYVYDLQVPDLGQISSNTRPSWRDKIFKRGN